MMTFQSNIEWWLLSFESNFTILCCTCIKCQNYFIHSCDHAATLVVLFSFLFFSLLSFIVLHASFFWIKQIYKELKFSYLPIYNLLLFAGWLLIHFCNLFFFLAHYNAISLGEEARWVWLLSNMPHGWICCIENSPVNNATDTISHMDVFRIVWWFYLILSWCSRNKLW